ncbi:MAG: HutD family protein [Terrimesophilobacter sp.]
MPDASADRPGRADQPARPDHPLRVVVWADLIAQPWRNGGGMTRQILSMRLGGAGKWMPCTDDGWDWRLSIADVESPGPFSRFDGMTRIITIIEGESVMLTVNGAVEVLEKYRPFTFAGGAETSAKLPHGPIRDLNLIARTGIVDAKVSVEVLSADRPRRVSEGQYCVLLEGYGLLRNDAIATDSAGTVEDSINRFDTVVGDPVSPRSIRGDGILAIITVTAAPTATAAPAPAPPDRTGLR